MAQMSPAELALQTGVFVRGLFMGTDQAYSFVDKRDGRQVSVRPAIRVLVGKSIVKVPYSPDVASDELQAILESRHLELVELPVWASGPFDEVARTSAPVKYRLRVNGHPVDPEPEAA